MSDDPNAGMLPEQRRAYLLDALARTGSVRVGELADELGVTPITIRRDITQLAHDGLVRKVHGGAAAVREPVPRGQERPADREGLLGMLVPSLGYYWPDIVRGIEEECTRTGFGLVVRGSSYTAADEQAQVEHLVEQAGVDGLLLAPNLGSPRLEDFLARLSDLGLPTVLVERRASHPDGRPFDSVASDHAAGAELAIQHFAELGHTRVGLVLRKESVTAPHVRRGWERGIAASGLTDDLLIDRRLGERSTLTYHQAVEDILDACLDSRTTALLVHADDEAIAIVQAAEARGVRVPDELTIVAYDDDVAGVFSPALSAIRPPRRSLGRAAVWLLRSRIEDPKLPTHQIAIMPTLHVRATSAPPAS